MWEIINIFPHSRLSFYFPDGVFWCPKAFNFGKSNLFKFFFSHLGFHHPRSQKFASMLSSRSLTVSALPLRFRIHYEWISGYDLREGPNFILLHPAVHLPQHHLLSTPNGPLNGLSTLTENQSVMNVKCISDCTVYSLVYSSLPLPVPRLLDYCGSEMSFDMGKQESSNAIFFSRLHWLLWVSCISIWILEPAHQFLPKSQAGSWQRLYWTCRSTWRVLPSWQYGLPVLEHGMAFIYSDLWFFFKYFISFQYATLHFS